MKWIESIRRYGGVIPLVAAIAAGAWTGCSGDASEAETENVEIQANMVYYAMPG